jgi:hypothetical protein
LLGAGARGGAALGAGLANQYKSDRRQHRGARPEREIGQIRHDRGISRHANGQKVGHEDPATYRGENLLLADMQTKFRQELNTRTGNPSIPAAPRLVARNDNDEREWRTVELHREGNTYAPLDFKDFIPAADNPLSKAADGKPVGLEPDQARINKPAATRTP